MLALLAATAASACSAAPRTAATGRPAGAPATTATSVKTVPQGVWSDIAPAPGAADGAPVWAGGELVVWSGGLGRDAGGAAYRPADGAWRPTARSPLSARRGHTGVWTGREVVYWGGRSASDDILGDGAAYDPAADRWRLLPPAPIPARFLHEAVWTGREVVVWGGVRQCCPIDSVIHDAAAAAYDPAADRWRRLPDVPAPWSGDDGAAVTGAADGRVFVWRRDRVGVLDPGASAWREVPGPPAQPASGEGCTTTGSPFAAGAVAVDRLVVGYELDLRTARWRALGAAPPQGLSAVAPEAGRLYGVTATADPVLVMRDRATGTWADLGQPPGRVGGLPAVLWTGSAFVLWGGFSRSGAAMRTGVMFRPAP